MAKKKPQSPRPRKLKDEDPVKLNFILNAGQRRRFQVKLAALGLAQSDVLRAFCLAFSDRYTTGSSLGLEIICRTKKGTEEK